MPLVTGMQRLMLVICFSDNRLVLVNQSRNKAWTKIKSSVNAYYRTQCHWHILLVKPLHVVREIAIGCPAVSCGVLRCPVVCPVVFCSVLWFSDIPPGPDNWGLVICELRNGELIKCELGCKLGL